MTKNYEFGFEIVSDGGSTMLGGNYHNSVVVNFDSQNRLFEVVGEGECTWGGTDIDNVEDLLRITKQAAGPYDVDWDDLLHGVRRLDIDFGKQLEIWMEKLSNEDVEVLDSQVEESSPVRVQTEPNETSPPTPRTTTTQSGTHADKMRRVYAGLAWEQEAMREEAEDTK